MRNAILRAAACSMVAGLTLATTGCGGSRAAGAQSPPPPSLSAPVRVVESSEPPPATVVPADEVARSEKLPDLASSPDLASPAGAPETGKPEFYVMQKGDTLYAIARRFNVAPKDLIAANNFPNPNKLPVGTRVRIP